MATPQIRIANYSGQNQEIHYQSWIEIKDDKEIQHPAETVIVEPGEFHDIDFKRIGHSEMTRLVNIFTEIKEEKRAARPQIERPKQVKDGE